MNNQANKSTESIAGDILSTLESNIVQTTDLNSYKRFLPLLETKANNREFYIETVSLFTDFITYIKYTDIM